MSDIGDMAARAFGFWALVWVVILMGTGFGLGLGGTLLVQWLW